MTSSIKRPDPAVLERLEQMAVPAPHDGPMVQALRREAADLAQQMREQDAGACEVCGMAAGHELQCPRHTDGQLKFSAART